MLVERRQLPEHDGPGARPGAALERAAVTAQRRRQDGSGGVAAQGGERLAQRRAGVAQLVLVAFEARGQVGRRRRVPVQVPHLRADGEQHRAEAVVELDRHAAALLLHRGIDLRLDLPGDVQLGAGAAGQPLEVADGEVAERVRVAHAAVDDTEERAIEQDRHSKDSAQALTEDLPVEVVREGASLA